MDTPLLLVRERTLEHGPNWGFLIALAFCIEIWLLVYVAVAELT